MFPSTLLALEEVAWNKRATSKQLIVGDAFVSDKPTNKPPLPTQDVSPLRVHGEVYPLTDLN